MKNERHIGHGCGFKLRADWAIEELLKMQKRITDRDSVFMTTLPLI
jgi:hypothetical protein